MKINHSFILTNLVNSMLLKLAILISGRGSNMQAILNAIKKQSIPINPVIVISNKPTARGLRIAKRFGKN